MLPLVRRLLLLFWALLPAPALAAIGDPCPDGQCTPGEVCVRGDGEDSYCTGRCPEGGCPDGFYCRASMGTEVCARGDGPPPLSPLGGPCGAETRMACEEGLVCSNEGYCTQPCAGVGTCPDGYRCTPNSMLCARRNGPPGYGEPCAEGGACADPLVCIQWETRTRAFCTTPCDDGAPCGGGFNCEAGHCVPPAVVLPGFGQPCAPDAADPLLAGCEGEHICHVDGDTTYCTRECTPIEPCPAGYGCVEVEPRYGECRRGQPDTVGFGPQGNQDVPDFTPPPTDAGLPQDPEPTDDGGCNCELTGGVPDPIAVLLILGAILRRRRRAA